MKEYAIITFKPINKKVAVRKGTDLLSAMVKGGIFITSSCGGKGVCGRCRVKILNGNFKTEPTGKISEQDREKGIFLACRTIIFGNTEVEILPETLLPEKEIKEKELFAKGEEFHLIEVPIKEIYPFSPLSRKYFFRLTPPTLEDNVSDFERICRKLKKYEGEKFECETDLPTLRRLPSLLRGSNWEITTTVVEDYNRREMIIVEPGDNSRRNYGVAIDVGTTTIAASLIDLKNGENLKTEISFNKQTSYGEDIISRIIYAEKDEGLETLHHLVCETINELIQNLSESCSINLNDITCVVCSGNMTMTHLLLKINPSFLRKEPYVPVSNFFPKIKAAEVGIRINPGGIMEVIGGAYPYVGGDITSGLLISRIYEREELNLLIDIGTNGEIVLGNKDWMVCCSASAGPAFEGSGVKHGMRAIGGAIQGVQINGERVKVETIDNQIPLGICGSGYIDIISELYKNGITNRNGVIVKENERVREGEDGKEFIVVPKEKSGTGEDIVITQVDIENLIRAKAAIFAALSILIKKSGVEWEDISKIYVAGGFGTYLNIKKAISIGLLPDFSVEKFKFLGNASLLGCQAYLLSKKAREMTRKIVSMLTYIELSSEPEYMEEYLKSLFIPHTDLDLFPSLKND